MTMIPASEIMQAMADRWLAEPETASQVALVKQMAEMWGNDLCSLDEIRHYTTGKARGKAALSLPKGDPLRVTIERLQDVLISHEGGEGFWATKQGYFSQSDLRQAGARVMKDEQGIKIEFPISQPWSRPPDASTGESGTKGTPVFRDKLMVQGVNVREPIQVAPERWGQNKMDDE